MNSSTTINIPRLIIINIVTLFLINGLTVLGFFIPLGLGFILILPGLTILALGVGTYYLWATNNKTFGWAILSAGLINLILWTCLLYALKDFEF